MIKNVKNLIKEKTGELSIYLIVILMISLAFIFVKSGRDEQKVEDVLETAPPVAESVPAFLNENIRLKIVRLAMDVPVVINVNGADKDIYFDALESGVAHMQGTPLPGNKGNTVIFGHSSSPEGYRGEFGQAFDQLNEPVEGEQISLENSSGQSLIYKIIEKKTVKADDISVLEATASPRLTLITCWPVGTREKRLVIVAEQIAIKN